MRKFLDVMKGIEDKSIDMILCDLPYGMTACDWDVRIPFEPLWEAYKRIIKDNGAIVLTGSQPFTSELVMSNREWFKYELIWDKYIISGFLNANKMPLRVHENILIFYGQQPIYNPQKIKGNQNHSMGYNKKTNTNVYGKFELQDNKDMLKNLKHPKSIIDISKQHPSKNIHPTQKPVALFEYLIKTYTNEGDLVLDNCIGSGTTAVACIKTNRHYIGIELSQAYCDIANKRIEAEKQQLTMVI